MAKQKERSEAEFWKGKARELESEVKKLKKTNGRSAKKAKRLENLVENFTSPDEEMIETFPVRNTKVRCPECSSDDYEVVDLILKDLHRCFACNYHKTFAKAKK